jgi:hypothetical protein
MLQDCAFDDLHRPLSVEQAAAVQRCTWRSRQQALVFSSNDLTGRRENWELQAAQIKAQQTDANLAQILENGVPSVTSNSAGQWRKTLAAPCLVADAGGGRGLKVNIR